MSIDKPMSRSEFDGSDKEYQEYLKAWKDFKALREELKKGESNDPSFQKRIEFTSKFSLWFADSFLNITLHEVENIIDVNNLSIIEEYIDKSKVGLFEKVPDFILKGFGYNFLDLTSKKIDDKKINTGVYITITPKNGVLKLHLN